MAIKVGDCVKLPGSSVVMVVKQIISAKLILVCWDLDNRVHEAVFAPYELDLVMAENSPLFLNTK